MSLIVLSKNSYFRIAFLSIYHQIMKRERLCVIDVSSFLTLNDIRCAIKKANANQQYNVILFGGRDICSRILQPFGVHSIDLPVGKIKRLIRKTQSIESLLNHLNYCRALTPLSCHEHTLVRFLRTEQTLKDAASKMKMSERTFLLQSTQSSPET